MCGEALLQLLLARVGRRSEVRWRQLLVRPLEVVLRLGGSTAAAGGCSGSVLERGDAEQLVRA